jgi:hypothetical protein
LGSGLAMLIKPINAPVGVLGRSDDRKPRGGQRADSVRRTPKRRGGRPSAAEYANAEATPTEPRSIPLGGKQRQVIQPTHLVILPSYLGLGFQIFFMASRNNRWREYRPTS